MVFLTGYQDFLKIHDSINSQVYRARRVQDSQLVILKLLNRDYPTSEQIRRYKQEYHLICQLDTPGIIKAYSLEEWQRSYAIVLEDFGGISLKQWLKERKPISLAEFLFLAIAMSDSLGQIHAQNIIHKDINLANSVFNPETKELKIIDFGIATQLSRENPILKNPHVLEGTLAYISPEQTGRMNRGLDYRTDFYSLGVTLYELLTGKLPFIAEDALELIHCHLAKQPRSPSEINSSIPAIVSEIILKLMAKNAEDRYQSAWGLKIDLETCAKQLAETKKIISFSLGQKDISDRFQIPQKLYGREREIETLLATFARVAATGNVELMLVTGYSGIGKSALVQELYKPIVARRGYFIAGKFDQFQRNIPYSAIVVAFRRLMGQLLGENESQLQRWREKILRALGNNGKIMIDVIPEVELIIGKQPAVPILGANEAQNRFNLTIGNFIRVFCDREHPLTLFLDDLQWADLATLKLLERILVGSQVEYLLILGAYRDNEVSLAHPLTFSLEQLRQDKVIINQMILTSLPLKEIYHWVGDALQQTSTIVEDLAQLIQEKTGGNPFFINEFLQALHDENLVKFHPQARNWQWDIDAIAARNFTDNVVELMVEKLQKLSESTQEVLSLAACLGAEFDLTRLTWLHEKSSPDIFELLKVALDRRFIFPLSELDENLLIQSYKFAHDRIQQAAYTLIPVEKRAEKHAAIGRILLENTSESEQEEKRFDIVDQLNQGIGCLSDLEEREQLARLNLQAGCKAIAANAYAAAIAYFDTGISLLESQSWQSQYELTLNLYQEATKATYLNAEIDRMETLAGILAKEAKNPRDRLELAKIKVDAYTNQGRLAEALETGLESLVALGIEFPREPSPADFASTFAKIQTLIGDRQPADLANLPAMQDPLIREALALLVKIATVTYVAAPTLFPLIIFKQIELSIVYGNSSASTYSYSSYGGILCGVMEEFSRGYQYGQLALKLLSQFNDRQFKVAVFAVIYRFINHWQTHLKKDIKPLQEAVQMSWETGDLSFGGHANNGYCFRLYLTGRELSETEREIKHHNEILEAIGQKNSLNYNRPFLQAVLNLQGRSPSPHQLVGKVMDEKSLISYYQNTNNGSGLWLIYVIKATLCYLFEEFEEAIATLTLAQQYSITALSHPMIPVQYFYDSLTQLARYPLSKIGRQVTTIESNYNDRERFLSRVRDNQEKMQRWADSAPMNYLHKFYLVEAEYYRVIGEKVKAIEFYNLAIAKAKENEYIQEEALANELAAKFYLNWDIGSVRGSTESDRRPNSQEKVARVYMLDAHYGYSRWGAIAKVKHLEANYSQLCQSSRTKISATQTLDTRMTRDSTGGEELDLATVIKSTNAISSEIVLEKLLATLMNILIENAGAGRGILILPHGDSLWVEASKEENSEQVLVLQSLAIEEFAKLSSKIVNYVARTGETVVLNDATRAGNFTDDIYIQQHQCQSIACTPLINQGKLQGIIYLENNLTTRAFTKARMALLRTLATQAAISLENARFYDACKRFVPSQFLSFLEKKSIVDIELGDRVERVMTVLFADIRDFTTLSEQMTPRENFAFINEYLGAMEPHIQANGGFIDKYIGDAIMALFPDSEDSALQGAIAMLAALKIYNQKRQKRNLTPIRIGIGLHTGMLMLGTVGGASRMDGTAIGDAVNLSSRVEGLTKTYGISLLITQQTLIGLRDFFQYDFRFIERVKAKGKAQAVSLFEVFSADPPDLRAAKNASKTQFERGVILFHQQAFTEAARLFTECLQYHQGDRVARNYLDRCDRYTASNLL